MPIRCRACASEVKPGLRVCPECGATLGRGGLARQIRCRSCQNPVPSNLRVCPHCGAALRRSWQSPLLGLLAVLLALGFTYVVTSYLPWDKLRSAAAQVQVPSVAFLVTPTATPSHTATRRPSSTPTATWTSTPLPLTSTATQTPLPPTATPRPATPTARPLPAATALADLVLASPKLVSPGNGDEFRGGDSQIQLTWESIGALAEDEWYSLSLRFAADGATRYNGTWTKDTSWTVPPEAHATAGQSEREFHWDVIVMRQTGTRADGGREGVPISPSSETWIFLWY